MQNVCNLVGDIKFSTEYKGKARKYMNVSIKERSQ